MHKNTRNEREKIYYRIRKLEFYSSQVMKRVKDNNTF